MNMVENIRDFNGFSWNVNEKRIENRQINLAFQNLLYLTDMKFIYELVQPTQEAKQLVEKLEIKMKEEYTEEKANMFLEQFYQVVIENKIKQDENIKQELLKQQGKIEEQLKKMQKKTEYIKEITEKRKEAREKIKEIDTLIHDKEKLMVEFVERNEKLPEEEKIFSLAYLLEILEEEREEYISKNQEYSEMLEPKKFLEKKQKLEKQKIVMEKLPISETKREESAIIELQKAFLACMLEKIQKIETKKEMAIFIYIFRYYLLLPIEKTKKIADLRKIGKEVKKVRKVLLQKAIQMKVMNTFSNAFSVDFAIIKPILESHYMELNKIELQICKIEDKKNKEEIFLKEKQEESNENEKYTYIFTIEVYNDIREGEYQVEIETDIPVKELEIKKNKKIKLFI